MSTATCGNGWTNWQQVWPIRATAPEDACAEILALLDSHNAKEEPIIHPYLDSDLNEADRALVRDLLAVGTLPDGWVCQALR